jgi:hypothetical protein
MINRVNEESKYYAPTIKIKENGDKRINSLISI